MTREIKLIKGNPISFLLWIGAILAIFLLALRLYVVSPYILDAGYSLSLPIALYSFAEDALLVLAAVFVFVTLSRSLPKKFSGVLVGLFASFSMITAGWGLVNLVALKMLNAPLTVAWVRYSDIGNTDVILDSLRHLLPLSSVLAGVAVLVSLLLLTRFAARNERNSYIPKAILSAVAIAMLGGFVVGHQPSPVPSGKQRNPLVAFTQSVFSENESASLERLASKVEPDLHKEWPFGKVAGLERPEGPSTKIRNVIVFAYESTPAKQSQGFGGVMPVTPNLLASLSNGLAFDRAYAHVPASNYFLVSAIASAIPELSSVSTTYTHPDFDFNALPKVLNAAGFRTGFFNSSDNRFQNTDTFVRAAGFETVKDYRDWVCEAGVYEFTSVSEKFLNTSSDLCTVEKITDWIDQDRDQPFFVTFRTGMTHYPYFPGENPIDFGVEDENYGNYLNALRVGDQAFGELLTYLGEAGLMDETLIVVMGDHGEAFGEHGTYVHAAGIYEENVHIPLALINPQLFDGARSNLIVGLVDVAPTITDLMGLETPETWQGNSFFAPSRPNGVMLFAPWNGFLIGYREGDEKVIYNANSDELEVYNLRENPGELVSLAPQSPNIKASKMETLAEMVATHRSYIDALLGGEKQTMVSRPTLETMTIAASGTYLQERPKVWVKLDGVDVGGFTVTSAISNEFREVPSEEIHAALEKFVLPLEQELNCPKRLEIYFLNDNWGGEGKTGDTDLWVRSVTIGGSVYHSTRFRELKARVGHNAGEYYRFSRSGGAYVDLYLDQHCLAEALETENPNP